MKRLGCLLLVLAAVFSLAGCASMFDREYYVVEEYEVPSEPAEPDDEADTISNYASLRRAIVRLVSEHTESAQLQFQNYDGAISQDISTACWEVKSSTALGAFAVDYISYDLSRIVSYYQAEIYITYKRAAWQVDAVENVSNVRALETRMEDALRNGETYLVLELSSAAISADTVRDSVERLYYGDPLVCPVLPNAETGVFPESGVSHILEITLDYGLDSVTLEERRSALSEALEEMRGELADDESEYALLTAIREFVVSRFTLSDTGSTAWDALAGGEADSEGAAMAMEACCRSAGVACVTVSGRLDGAPHFWNIVELDGKTYHADLSAEDAFLLSDEAMLSLGCWWDNSEYPACEESYDPNAQSSEEPEATGEIEE